MTCYRLPEHLGICEVDRRLLMLDLRRDLYLELDHASAAALRRWRDGPARDEAGMARLVERGMIEPADRPQPCGWAELPIPRRSLLDLAVEPPRRPWILLPEVGAAIWSVRRRLRQGLERAVGEVRCPNPPAAAPGYPDREVARFRAARRLVPFPANCLTDSLALARFLRRRKIAFRLVFGVKLDPFAAHCWLQTDEMILNDAADTAGAFTPILVV